VSLLSRSVLAVSAVGLYVCFCLLSRTVVFCRSGFPCFLFDLRVFVVLLSRTAVFCHAGFPCLLFDLHVFVVLLSRTPVFSRAGFPCFLFDREPLWPSAELDFPVSCFLFNLRSAPLLSLFVVHLHHSFPHSVLQLVLDSILWTHAL